MTAESNACFITPPALGAGVSILTTLRGGAGVSIPPFDHFNLGLNSGDDRAAVAANRAQLIDLACLPSAPRWLQQVHGTTVCVEPGADTPEADAALTSRPGIVLAVLTADCLPVVLAAPAVGKLGVAHAGWRGLAAGVIEATLEAMAVSPDELRVWLGPAAGPTSYEVGDEVREAFCTADERSAEAFVSSRPGHWRMDIYALARRRLLAAGLANEVISGGDFDTIADERFYSYRRDGRTGRMATVAWLTGA